MCARGQISNVAPAHDARARSLRHDAAAGGVAQTFGPSIRMAAGRRLQGLRFCPRTRRAAD